MGAFLIFLLQVLLAVLVTGLVFPVLLILAPASGSLGRHRSISQSRWCFCCCGWPGHGEPALPSVHPAGVASGHRG